MKASAGKNVLVVKPNGLGVGGVNTYLMDRLPKLSEGYGYNIWLFFPGEIIVQEQADKLRHAGIKLVEGRIGRLHSLSSQLKLRKALDKLMLEVKFDIIHVNTASLPLEYHALKTAWTHGIPVRIAHSHNTTGKQSIIKRLTAPLYRIGVNKSTTTFLACSQDAGEYLFGKVIWSKFGRVVRNGIDVSKYSYDLTARAQIRRKLGSTESSRVFGFVGNLIDQKNPLFLIDIFSELHRQDESSVLWVVGDGPRLEEMKGKTKDLGLSDYVSFLGKRTDVPILLQGMDALVLPSLYEGLGLVLIEAQAAGLPCFVSTNVPKEARIPGCTVLFLPLNQGLSEWVEPILKSDLSRNERGSELVVSAGYSLDDCIEEIALIYSGSVCKEN